MQDVCTHIQGVVIGRKFSAAETGLYNQAKKMDEVASMTLPAVMCQVLFPVYSELQEDKRALSDVLSGNIRMISFVIFPIMMLLIIVARPLFEFLYGAQWLDAVPYFQLLCVGGFFSALYNFCYYAVAAVGRSKELFLWGCYKWGVLLVLLLVGASVSMRGVLVAMVVSNINIWLTNALLAQRYVGYGVVQQIKDIASALAMTLLCGGVVYWAYNDLELNWLLCVALFVAAYVALAWVCGVGALKEIRTFVVKYLKRRGDDRC
jgi:O-antigen/teichoic acid export membrane protein